MVPFLTKFVALSTVTAFDVSLDTDSLQLLQSHIAVNPRPTKEPRPFDGPGRRGPQAHPRANDPEHHEKDTEDAFAEVDPTKYHDIKFTNVVQNNLGGMGPDGGKEEIRYANAAEVEGKQIDIVLTATGYNTTQTSRNGLLGEVGIVNMVNNDDATFQFKFVESGTDTPVVMEPFILAFLDLDKGMKGGRETLQISGYSKYSTLANTEVIVDAGAGTFTGSVHGTKADNPNNPKMLTDVGARRTVNFEFPAGLSEVDFTYKITQNFNKRDFEGREFMFAGMTSVYFCKTKKVDLDFSLATLEYSNLGAKGPDLDKPEGIRYGKVATFADGRQIDMVINALTPYNPGKKEQNGIYGHFGQVNMATNTETRFRFTFKEPDSDTDAKVDWMYFSLFDLDEAKKGKQRESFDMEGVSTHFMTERSLVQVTEMGVDRYMYSSTRKGTGKDNPKDPMAMTQRQRDMSVSFLFHNKTSFEATFKIGKPSGGSRNFNFAGQSNTVFC